MSSVPARMPAGPYGSAERHAAGEATSRDRGYGVRVQGSKLRRELDIRGVTGTEVARRAGVAPSTVSQALRDQRVHPRSLQKIAAALAAIAPLPDLVKLLDWDQPGATSDGRA